MAWKNPQHLPDPEIGKKVLKLNIFATWFALPFVFDNTYGKINLLSVDQAYLSSTVVLSVAVSKQSIIGYHKFECTISSPLHVLKKFA